MTLLATVLTETGKVELHHEAGVFTTRGHLDCDARTGSVTTILIARERAQEWYDLCALRGAVHGEFPEAVAV